MPVRGEAWLCFGRVPDGKDSMTLPTRPGLRAGTSAGQGPRVRPGAGMIGGRGGVAENWNFPARFLRRKRARAPGSPGELCLRVVLQELECLPVFVAIHVIFGGDREYGVEGGAGPSRPPSRDLGRSGAPGQARGGYGRRSGGVGGGKLEFSGPFSSKKTGWRARRVRRSRCARSLAGTGAPSGRRG